MINDKLETRFSELKNELDEMPHIPGKYGGRYVEPGIWKKWATSVESLLMAACGADSPYYLNFIKEKEKCRAGASEIKVLAGIFQSAREAFDGGYLFDVERDISAEIFSDFVVLAKQALAEDNKDVAAVLASAALEDALKRHATSNGLNVDEAPMSEVINALKSKGLVSGAQKMLAAMVQTRNHAMHAKWKNSRNPPSAASSASSRSFC